MNSTGLTSITPTGALGKLTQLTYAVLDPGNISTNLMTAGINGEVAGNASNLLMDIKPGYMLGAKPRQQAMGHVLGIIAGSLVAPPVFYILFRGDISLLGGEQLPMIAAKIWQAVAEILTKGLSFLDVTARWAILIGAVLGLVFEFAKQATHGKFWLSAVGIGLAFILPFFTSLSMFLGGLIFWVAGKTISDKSPWHRKIVQNQEAICAGVIAGGAIMGIVVMLVELQ
ncbi:MAG: OPT/YSL family transporter [Deltaproteobacteria bacterium]|nr:OPT/YSL family transporter [Deltaproteobacteria bacterium]